MSALFGESLEVINVGVAGFADNIRDSGAPVVPVDWRPPGVASSIT